MLSIVTPDFVLHGKTVVCPYVILYGFSIDRNPITCNRRAVPQLGNIQLFVLTLYTNWNKTNNLDIAIFELTLPYYNNIVASVHFFLLLRIYCVSTCETT